MYIHISENYDEMSRHTAEFIAGFINKKRNSLVCFAAGDTPAGTYQNLVGLSKSGGVNWSECMFVGLDEWANMDRYDEGSCKNFVYKSFFDLLPILDSQIVFFDACSKDLESECKRVDDYIVKNGPIDLMLVGMGMNGHIGLNEPGASFDGYSHVVDLDPLTKKVGQKYFSKPTRIEHGITLGLRHLMEAETVILVVSGSKKAEMLKRAIEGDITEDIPASILQKHKNCYLFLDTGAAALLNRKD